MSVLFGCMRFKKRFQSFRSISNLRWLDHEWMIKKEQIDPLANKVVNKFCFIPILHHSILELEIKLPHSVLFLTDQFINSTQVWKKMEQFCHNEKLPGKLPLTWVEKSYQLKADDKALMKVKKKSQMPIKIEVMKTRFIYFSIYIYWTSHGYNKKSFFLLSIHISRTISFQAYHDKAIHDGTICSSWKLIINWTKKHDLQLWD